MPPLPASVFEAKLDQLIALLSSLAAIESPTDNKHAVDQVSDYILRWSQGMGAAVTRHPQSRSGDHLLLEWGSGPGGILMLAHMDTVHPLGSLQQIPIKRLDGRLHGPGVQDMKGGLAMALMAVRILLAEQRMPARRISLLCTSDEETGSSTSRLLIEALAQTHDLVLCLEPAIPDGSLKTWRKGIGVFRLDAVGRASHAGGDPENGINAIEEVCRQVPRILQLADAGMETTISVGRIAGGTRINVVPDACHAIFDIRIRLPEEQIRIDAGLAALEPILEGARIKISGEWNRPPMPRTPIIMQTFARAREIGAQLGLNLSEGGVGGGSDANFVAPLGIPLLDGLGPVGGGAHSRREFIMLDDFAQRTALLGALLSEWFESD